MSSSESSSHPAGSFPSLLVFLLVLLDFLLVLFFFPLPFLPHFCLQRQ